jgi:hypothetical protein
MAFFRTKSSDTKSAAPASRKASARAAARASGGGGGARVVGNVALSPAEPDEAQFTKFK